MIAPIQKLPKQKWASALPSVLFTVLLHVLLSGCATTPSVASLMSPPMPHELASAPDNLRDGRSRFQQIFCDELQAGNREASAMRCDYWLLAPPASADQAATIAPHAKPSLNALADNIQLLIIPGAFSECFGPDALAFTDAAEALRTAGVRVSTDVVSGRSGITRNARQIADYIRTHYTEQGPPLVLVGYSKGANDALQFLTQYPELAARVSALVSVAGAVGGSPVADGLYPVYDLLLSHLPWPQCGAGDGQVVESLRTEVRAQWLQAHQLPDHVRYYSLAAITSDKRTARALRPTWNNLLKHSRHNDGQLLAVHALIPGSTLLAYMQADHWSIATRLERSHRILAHRPHDVAFPQTALLTAITRQVAEDLEHPLK